jgi:hypothetical protein
MHVMPSVFDQPYNGFWHKLTKQTQQKQQQKQQITTAPTITTTNHLKQIEGTCLSSLLLRG